ncbi:MAG: M20/M25/M40 family metallo-hydrolase [Bacteroidales bacterium]
MKKTLWLIIVFTAFAGISQAQKKSLALITAGDFRSYMMFFASDELAGRETGTIQNNAAALYLKTNAMRIGLKPAPGASDYFQPVSMVATKLDKENTFLKMTGAGGETFFTTDSVMYLALPSASQGGELSGKLVFGGYGVLNKDKSYNDFGDLDLKGKILLIMTGSPDTLSTGSGVQSFDENTESPKIMAAIIRGAKGILFVYNPSTGFKDAYSSGIAEMLPSESVTLKGKQVMSLPVHLAFITRHTADLLLRPTGSDLGQMQAKIKSTGKPVSVEVPDISVTLKAAVNKSEYSAPNVIGIVEGSDPGLKKECVIYTAHFDHTGIGSNGEINNGADDDASGSIAMLGIADAFMKLKQKPLRTIVFAWVNGEEKGLLGSEYYTTNPLMPLEKTLVDINMDMVGRSKMPSDTGKLYGYDLDVSQPGEIYVYSAHESSELISLMNESAREAGIRVIDKGKDLTFGSSDHIPFRQKGVPSLLLHSGIHADLHGPRDDADKVDYDKMEKTAGMAFLIGYKVANQKKRIVIDKP